MRSNMLLFAYRNVRVFFRDRASVVFSMMGALIVIALYFLFLGDFLVQSYSELPNAREILDSWAMAGLLAIVPVTTTLGALGIMIDDNITGAARDFTVSPMKRYEIVGGYVISTFVVGVVMSLLSLAFAEAYIVSNGGDILGGIQFAKVIGLILISVLSASAIMLLVALLISSHNAYGMASTIVGTLIGFLTGVFIPIGVLPSVMGSVVKIIPASHSASLFRQVMMEKPMEVMSGMPAEDILKFELDLGVRFEFGDLLVGPGSSIIILLGVAAVFFIAAIIKLSIKK